MDEPINEVQRHFATVWVILGLILTGAGGLIGAYIALVSQMKTIVHEAIGGLKDHIDHEMNSLEKRVDRLEDHLMHRGMMDDPGEE